MSNIATWIQKDFQVEIPVDGRPILKAPVAPLLDDNFVYIGIEKGLKNQLIGFDVQQISVLKLQFNKDGIPLY